MADDYKVGDKKPPKDTQFGGPRANRRNNNGRPKSFDQLRKMALRVAAEDVFPKGGGVLSRVELMFMAMASSKNSQDRRLFLEYAFGKVTDKVDHTSGGEKIKQSSPDELALSMKTLADALKDMSKDD